MNEKLNCGLTETEYSERLRLLELQKSKTRWFTKEEYDRLKELSNKMFIASKVQICYKTGEVCKYDCKGLCKDSY